MDGVFVGSGIFKSGDPAKRANAIVKATTHFDDPAILAEVSRDLGEPMVGRQISSIPEGELIAPTRLVSKTGMEIGILALQGDFIEHFAVLQELGVAARLVKLPAHLDGLDGLIIPGGESTTIGKLAVAYDLMAPLREFGREKAIWGTCAGAIFLSKDVKRDQPLLNLMDIEVERNAFGRQVDSFEVDLTAPFLKEGEEVPYHAVFIRAPDYQQSVWRGRGPAGPS